MTKECQKIHELFNSLKIFSFPFNEKEIFLNGIYILFEKGEMAHNTKRIVRVGTHTGENQLPARLIQHFIVENKDRSIFRKNIGRALLNKNKDSYLKIWEIDLTPKIKKEKFQNLIDKEKQSKIEKEVTKYIRENFSFAIIPVENPDKRIELESKIISTISLCKECKPSENWLGLFSPKEKIRESGLWQVNELNKIPLSNQEIDKLAKDLKPLKSFN